MSERQQQQHQADRIKHKTVGDSFCMLQSTYPFDCFNIAGPVVTSSKFLSQNRCTVIGQELFKCPVIKCEVCNQLGYLLTSVALTPASDHHPECAMNLGFAPARVMEQIEILLLNPWSSFTRKDYYVN